MSASLRDLVLGGIPPDPDQWPLMQCCYGGCAAKAEEEPLIVVGVAGKLATLCRFHLDLLSQSARAPAPTEEGRATGDGSKPLPSGASPDRRADPPPLYEQVLPGIASR